jgi:hypothetical protein
MFAGFFFKNKALLIIVIDCKEICGTPAEKRAAETPQGGTSEEAWLFVRGKGVDFLSSYIKSTLN